VVEGEDHVVKGGEKSMIKDIMVDQICFDKTSFYTFVVVGIAVIGYVLYVIHIQQLQKISEGFNTELQQQQDQMLCIHNVNKFSKHNY